MIIARRRHRNRNLVYACLAADTSQDILAKGGVAIGRGLLLVNKDLLSNFLDVKIF